MFGFSTVEILLAVLNFLVFVLILVLVSLGSNLSSLLKENTDKVFEIYREFEAKLERIIDAVKYGR